LKHLRLKEAKSRVCVEMEFAPGEELWIQDPAFADFLQKELQQRSSRGLIEWLKRGGRGPVAIYGLGLLALVITAYILLLPPVSDALANRVPASVDREMGASFFEGFQKTHAIETEASTQLAEFAREVGLGSDRFEWYVVREDVVNAFALPDGKVVVYTGLLEKLEAPGELAGLLGHEAAHVRERHSIRMLVRRGLGSSILGLFFGTGASGSLVGQAEALGGLSYSRSFESEADREAVDLLISRGLDPRGMIGLLHRLVDESAGDSRLELFSTHPHPEARMEALEKRLEKNSEQITEDPELKTLFDRLQSGL
jgi:Zn-dependent protease with chaperone function